MCSLSACGVGKTDTDLKSEKIDEGETSANEESVSKTKNIIENAIKLNSFDEMKNYVEKFSNEKHNFVEFIYSKLGRQFILYAVYSLNKDSYKTPGLYVPKVDWTRSWTVEEILKEYDYTEEEIKKVMEDLKNYKGMED